MKAEIQVRTVLQDTWATVSHKHVYKNGDIVSDTNKRRLHRLAALLEQADEVIGEFVRLTDEEKAALAKSVGEGDYNHEINAFTLGAYVRSSPTVQSICAAACQPDGFLLSTQQAPTLEDDEMLRLSFLCNVLRIQTLRELDLKLEDAQSKAQPFLAALRKRMSFEFAGTQLLIQHVLVGAHIDCLSDEDYEKFGVGETGKRRYEEAAQEAPVR